MHRFRYRVAVEQWGWRIPGLENGLDIDEFDTPNTIYFLAFSNAGDRIVGCGRLNPTDEPHMLSSVFRNLCNLQPSPQSPSVYEFSRYIVDHQTLSKEEQFAVRGRISATINKFCLRAGIEALTWFAYQQTYARALKMWDTQPLGTPKYFDDDDATYIAAVSTMNENGLSRLRHGFKLLDEEPALIARQPWDNLDPATLRGPQSAHA
jgi:acyl-homoserine lactone synthase